MQVKETEEHMKYDNEPAAGSDHHRAVTLYHCLAKNIPIEQRPILADFMPCSSLLSDAGADADEHVRIANRKIALRSRSKRRKYGSEDEKARREKQLRSSRGTR